MELKENLEEEIDMKTFSYQVEKLVREKPQPYLDAIVTCATQFGMEVEVAAKLLSRGIKDKLEEEAHSMNLLQKTSVLPI